MVHDQIDKVQKQVDEWEIVLDKEEENHKEEDNNKN